MLNHKFFVAVWVAVLIGLVGSITGYAGDVLENALNADVNIVETVAHMNSATHFFDDVDVIAGPFWYAGPTFKRAHEFYPAEPLVPEDHPSNSMFSFAIIEVHLMETAKSLESWDIVQT